MPKTAYFTVAIYCIDFGLKQTEIDFQMNKNELYPIVKLVIIVGIADWEIR